MKKLLLQMAGATLGLWLSSIFIKGVAVEAYPSSNFFGIPLTQRWEIFVMLGIVLGLLNYFLKPLLKILSLPLEIITLGLFTIVINMGLIWFLDQIFAELFIPLLWPLLYVTIIIWAVNSIIQKILVKED